MPSYDPDGELPPPPPPSTAFNSASYLNAPPPTVPPAGFGGYAAPPPPPASADFSQSFDPSAFPPPAPAGTAAPAFGSEGFDSSFDPAAFAPPAAEVPSYDAGFDPSAFAAPTIPSYDAGFDPAAFAPPTSAFDDSAFTTELDDSIPIFDTGAFDAPAFDTAAFEAPPAPVLPPVYETPIAPAVPSYEAPAAPIAAAPVPSAPAFDASAFPAPAPEAAVTTAPPAVPVVAFKLDSNRPPRSFTQPAATPAPVAETAAVAETVPAPAAAPAPATAPAPAFDDLLQAAPTPPSYTLPVPVAAPTEVLPAATSAIPGDPNGRHADRPVYEAGAPVAPAAPVVELGIGQEGSDLDLVAALNAVVQMRASDLHIGVNSPPMVRVDGGLSAIPGTEAWDPDKVQAALHSIMSPEHRDIFANELELDFAYTLSEKSRFRVNIYQQRNSLGAAFRLIPTEIKQLAALGIPEKIGKFAQLPRGLVLVTGPTGSGKSTTLAALIDLVNSTRSDHIVTVEDPIEFMHQNKKSIVNQREVGHDTHSFNNALKHVLRQDPDVILIGELRDLETISVALTAAETGHLVFATLHTQDAPQTIDRVIDVFPPHQQDQVRAQLAATLQGVVCQTLVKKIGGQGRAVATEVLITTSAVANLIREGKTYQIHSALQAGRELGMHTLDQHLADLVNAGQISHQAAYEKAHDLEDLKQLIQRSAGASGAEPMNFSADGGGINFGDSYSKGA